MCNTIQGTLKNAKNKYQREPVLPPLHARTALGTKIRASYRLTSSESFITQCDKRRAYKNRAKLRHPVIVATLSPPVINDNHNPASKTFCTLFHSLLTLRSLKYNTQKFSYYRTENPIRLYNKHELVSVDLETINFYFSPAFLRNLEI
jgi:hypothetical protein